MVKKKILIFGITGQDGSYLAELLLDKGYEVHGVIRRASSFNTKKIDHIYDRIKLYYGDMTDSLSVDSIIFNVKPIEIYILAAQSFVKASFDIPYYTSQTNAIGVLNVLDAARKHVLSCKIYNASTSELFGKVQEIPQKETTPFYPRSPYGVSKLYAYWICKNYRESYNMFISNGILFNHESPRRGRTFVTRKITTILSDIQKKINNGENFKTLKLGNIDTKRDFGYAPDYVYGMWLMLQQDKPDDYILATNETHSIREFIKETDKHTIFDIVWSGEGLEEIGIDTHTGKIIVEIDPIYFRPAEVDILQGDYSKAKKELGWEPKIKFNELIEIIMKHDLSN